GCVGGRMIALNTDPIWEKLGDPSFFDDGLGNAYPPFAFNSGMDVRDVGRDEAEDLGLIEPNVTLTPQPRDIDADLRATAEVRDGWLRQAIEDSGLGRFDSSGLLHFGD